MSKKTTPLITRIIKGAMARAGITALDLASMTGIPYSTMMHVRFKNPGSWCFYEFGAVKRHIRFSPEELMQIEKLMEESTET